MRFLWVISLCIAIGGCAAQQEMGWARTDGKGIGGNAQLEQQYRVDVTICQGEMQKAGLTARPSDSIGGAYRQGQMKGEVFVGCMAQRGYLQQAIPTQN